MRSRFRILQVGFAMCMVAITAHVGFVQLHDRSLRKQERQQWLVNQSIVPVRGTIFSATGTVLAYDAPAYTIDLKASAIIRKRLAGSLSRSLAPIFAAKPSAILSQLERPGVIWLQMYPYMIDVPLATRDHILAVLKRLGLNQDYTVEKSYVRIYPSGRLASHVIGFTGGQGQGLAGIEYELNAALTGKPGVRRFIQDASGNPVPFMAVKTTPAQNGDNVDLTIDPVIQLYCEEALHTIQQRFSPQHAAIIVENPETGAILAMAVLPNYNPNHYWSFPDATLSTNWALDAPFEPGSTIKPEVLVGALATHSIRLDQTYMSGVVNVDGVPIHDWEPGGWGRLTYEQALIYSSNVGMVHIGQAEGVKTFYDYLDRFGFNHRTGIDLPGESDSILFREHDINPVDYATMAFGQGMAVTPIAQVAAMSAIANGGRLLTPYVVQRIIAPSGHVVYTHKVHVVDQVASPAIMRTVTNVMIKVVNDDPQGAMGVVPGYNIAGKTGTAEIPKPGGGYYANLYNLSFIGFAPAHHPRLLVYVTVNMPRHTAQWGDWVATPAARFVFQHALTYLRIPPHTSTGSTAIPTPESLLAQAPQSVYSRVPRLTGLPITRALAILRAVHDPVEVAGSARTGGHVLSQWPAAGQTLPSGSQVVLTVAHRLPVLTVTVPRLSGMLMTQALHALAADGLHLEPEGYGFGVTQNPRPGVHVAEGTHVQVTFSPRTQATASTIERKQS